MPAFLYSSIACVRLKKIAIVVSPLVAIIEDHVCLLANVFLKVHARWYVLRACMHRFKASHSVTGVGSCTAHFIANRVRQILNNFNWETSQRQLIFARTFIRHNRTTLDDTFPLRLRLLSGSMVRSSPNAGKSGDS